MNTADRSVEALDTALRRRFSFEFMAPDSSLVPEKLEDLDLRKVFEAINERITYLLEEDHQIGHSYFMEIKDEDGLRHVFKNKIIPLLKEYFYNDYGKVRLILGDGFIKEVKKPAFAVSNDDILEQESWKLLTIDDNFPIINALKRSLKDNSDSQEE